MEYLARKINRTKWERKSNPESELVRNDPTILRPIRTFLDYLTRKLNGSKHTLTVDQACEYIKADTITASRCIQSSNDTLSFWQCDNIQQDAEEVILALATGSKVSHIETMDIALIEKHYLTTHGIVMSAIPGDTLIPDLCGRHMDLVDLNLIKLCHVAARIATNIWQNSAYYRFTKSDVCALVANAVQSGRLHIDALPPKIQIDVQRFL